MPSEPTDISPAPLDMWLTEMDNLSTDELVTALRSEAKGTFAAEAAVELLISHGSWLQRLDFRPFVAVGRSLSDGETLLAGIDWRGFIDSEPPASASEAAILSLAASIAGVPSRVSLSELLSGLDDANTLIVMRAILHAHRGAAGSTVIVSPFS